MTLTGPQHRQLQEAMLAAFDDIGLRLLVRQELDASLDAVAGGRNTTEVVTNLIAWAEREGRIVDLIGGALRQNPANAGLQALADVAATWGLEPPAEPKLNAPYQGLAFFDVADEGRFFGRETLTAELVTFLKDHPFLTVVGASGCGKSSVVRAGVVPVLQHGNAMKGSDKWGIVIITPTSHPLKALAAVLTQDAESVTAQATLMDDMARDPRSLDLFAARFVAKTKAPRIMIIVDQFEELFTLCQDAAERKEFVDNLLSAATQDGVTTVILTLRADFYGYCAEFDNLRSALEACQRYIGPMAREELRAAIEKPAEQGGWDLEPGLTNRLLKDVDEQPGALPLLSHALLETWRRRNGRRLTLSGYEASGGVQGAIANTADELYVALSPEQQAMARNIFIRLTFVGEDVQTTRRRVPLNELVNGEHAVEMLTLLKRLQDARLVTTEKVSISAMGGDGGDTIFLDVAHEALIREWPRLRGWIDENRIWLRVHQVISEDTNEWMQARTDASYLYGSHRLDNAIQWVSGHIKELSADECRFLAESLVAAARADGKAGNAEKAYERLRLAAQLQPSLAAAYLELYTLAIERHDLESALDACQQLQHNIPNASLLPLDFEVKQIVDISDFGPIFLCQNTGQNQEARASGTVLQPVAVTLARWPSPAQDDVALRLLSAYNTLKSRWISRLLDISYWNGRYLIVCEYVEGNTLQSRLAQGDRLPVQQALTIITAIGRAMVDGHALQLCHLGLHPANILVTCNGPMLVRYGEARLRYELLGQSAPLPDITPYMAPEQNRQQRGDAASDIYSMGMLANHLLTGQAPDERLATRPSQADGRYDAAFDAWIARATAPKATGRFGSMAEMFDEWCTISGQEQSSIVQVAHQFLAVLTHGVETLRKSKLRLLVLVLIGLALMIEVILPPGPIHHFSRYALLLIANLFLLATMFYWQCRLKASQRGAVALLQSGAGAGMVIAVLFTSGSALWARSGTERVMLGNLPSGGPVASYLLGAAATSIIYGLVILLTLQFADQLPLVRRTRTLYVVYLILGLWYGLLLLTLLTPLGAVLFSASV